MDTRNEVNIGGEEVRLTIPLQITVQLGTPIVGEAGEVASGRVPRTGVPQSPPETARFVERLTPKEPVIDPDYSNRKGFNTDFLEIPVPLPTVTDMGVVAQLLDGTSHVLRYEHFSVVMHKERRLALFTASNVDGRKNSRQPDPTKKYSRNALTGLTDKEIELWVTEKRIPETDQLPDKFFSNDRGAFDRGHIVRRDDVCFGKNYEQVVRANGDTFHTTNCSPQVAGYNQSKAGEGNWGDLENFVLREAETEKYCLFAGPVLTDTDRAFKGVDNQGPVRVKIPRSFWKIVVARKGNELQAFAFVLEQDLSKVKFEALLKEGVLERADDPRTLEFLPTPEWEQKMVSIADLETRLGNLIRFPEAVRKADQSAKPGGNEIRRWARLDG